MWDTNSIKQRIAERADEFMEALFGDRAKRDGADAWRIGAHGSLSVTLKDGELVFYSHEEGIGGDAIALWQRERGVSGKDALFACAKWAGVGCANGVQPNVRPVCVSTKASAPRATIAAPPLLTGRDLADATLAAARLAGDAQLCERIAGERGWRADTLRELCHEPSLGWHDGKLAFIGESGMKLRWEENGARQIRWHCGKPWPWRAQFITSAITHVSLTEGETDAIRLIDAHTEADGRTLAVAMPNAGWGKSSVAIWRERFREKAVTLCFDADEAGQKYTEYVGAVLRHVAASVRVLDWKEIKL